MARPTFPGALVTLDEAKDYLRIVDAADDPAVTRTLTQASAIVFDYLDLRADPAWTPATVPPPIAASVLEWCGFLWEHRGDDLAPDGHDAAIWRSTEQRLRRFRDPALA